MSRVSINTNLPTLIDSRQMISLYSTLNIYKTIRILIPTSAIETLLQHIPKLEEFDHCKILIPKSRTNEHILYIFNNKEDQTPKDVAIDPSVEFDTMKSMASQDTVLTKQDRDCCRDLANIVCRLGTIIAPIVRSSGYNKMMRPYSCEIRLICNQGFIRNLLNPKLRKIDKRVAFKLNNAKCPKSRRSRGQRWSPGSAREDFLARAGPGYSEVRYMCGFEVFEKMIEEWRKYLYV